MTPHDDRMCEVTDRDRRGHVYLVGAGPGDPGLLTLRAADLLATADLVAHDRLVTEEVLARAHPEATVMCVGRRAGQPGWTQPAINELLISHARLGRQVVRLKGGDPGVFARGGEEVRACRRAGVHVTIVPGVSSVTAAPADAGVTLTERGVASGFAVITGHEDPSEPRSALDLAAVAAFPGTLVVLMGMRTAAELARGLIDHGRDPSTPTVVVSVASTPRRVIRRTDLAGLGRAVQGLAHPGVLVIGEVVARDPAAGAALADLGAACRR